MFHRILITFSMLSVLVTGIAFADFNPPFHPLFDGDAVHEIHLHFYEGNWWELLEDNFPEKIYLEASFDWENTDRFVPFSGILRNTKLYTPDTSKG